MYKKPYDPLTYRHPRTTEQAFTAPYEPVLRCVLKKERWFQRLYRYRHALLAIALVAGSNLIYWLYGR